MSEPTTRSLTVPETSPSPADASEPTRAPMCTARPPMSAPISSHSPVCTPARSSIPSARTSPHSPHAELTADVDVDHAVTTPVQHERRAAHERQDRADVDGENVLDERADHPGAGRGTLEGRIEAPLHVAGEGGREQAHPAPLAPVGDDV